MADLTERAVSWVLDVVYITSARLRESLGVPGARTLGRLASWTKAEDGMDIPELALNLSLLTERFLQLIASGLGTLALVWATVVLLGGFSTMLITMDFWFITAIVFIETARYPLRPPLLSISVKKTENTLWHADYIANLFSVHFSLLYSCIKFVSKQVSFIQFI